MQQIYLKNFITIGSFGLISLGMQIDKVISYLGEPENIINFDNGHSVMTYAYYEFFYLEETKILYGIQNDHLATFPNIKTGRVNNKRDICFQNDKFSINIWFLKKNRYLTFKEVVDNLQNENIEFEINEVYDNEKIIKFESGITFGFNDLSGMSTYNKDLEEWNYSEKIVDENYKVLNGMRYFNLSLI